MENYTCFFHGHGKLHLFFNGCGNYTVLRQIFWRKKKCNFPRPLKKGEIFHGRGTRGVIFHCSGKKTSVVFPTHKLLRKDNQNKRERSRQRGASTWSKARRDPQEDMEQGSPPGPSPACASGPKRPDVETWSKARLASAQTSSQTKQKKEG